MKKVLFCLCTFLYLTSYINMVVAQNLRDVISIDNVDSIRSLLQADPSLIGQVRHYNRNILFDTTSKSKELNTLLLEYGANPNHVDEFGITPVTNNTHNFELYMLFKQFGGRSVESDESSKDYLYSLVFDHVNFAQEDRIRIIDDILKTYKSDINKPYTNGLRLVHLITINYLTYINTTDYIILIELLKKTTNIDFDLPLEKDFHDSEYYPYDLKKGDKCIDIINKITKNKFYNGRSVDILLNAIYQ